MKILVVEDDQNLMNWFNHVLKDFEVTAADTSNKALVHLATSTFDYVCLDYNLIGGDTTEGVAQYINEHPECASQVIIHSACTIGSSILAEIIEDNCEFMPKPYELMKRLHTYIVEK